MTSVKFARVADEGKTVGEKVRISELGLNAVETIQ